MKWTIDDIEWDRFDPSKVDSMVLSVVRAASMVEYRSADYVTYLCNIFPDDEIFQEAARVWGEEEVQHGRALGEWAKLADPRSTSTVPFRISAPTMNWHSMLKNQFAAPIALSCCRVAWSK
jgi:hypothetical protein